MGRRSPARTTETLAFCLSAARYTAAFATDNKDKHAQTQDTYYPAHLSMAPVHETITSPTAQGQWSRDTRSPGTRSARTACGTKPRRQTQHATC